MLHHRHLDQYHRAKEAEHRTVTREELKDLLLADGKTEREAEQTLSIMDGLGSEVMIGDIMYGIKDEISLDEETMPPPHEDRS